MSRTSENAVYFLSIIGGLIIRSENRKRNNRIVFYLDDAEADLVREKMELAGIRNREAYIRKMILDGYIVRLDLSDVRKMVQLLSNATSNINQVARRANETGHVSQGEVNELREHCKRLWGLANIKR